MSDPVESIKTRLRVIQKVIDSAEAEKHCLTASLAHTPSHYQSLEDRWESLKSFILTYLEDILKVHKVVPNIEVVRIVAEMKYESCSREVRTYEWSLWLPMVENAAIPHYEKVIVTGKHQCFSPQDFDIELVLYLIRMKRLQFVVPR